MSSKMSSLKESELVTVVLFCRILVDTGLGESDFTSEVLRGSVLVFLELRRGTCGRLRGPKFEDLVLYKFCCLQ